MSLKNYASSSGLIQAAHNIEVCKQSDQLIHGIGTNYIPTLLVMLRKTDSPLTLMLVNLARKQQYIKIGYTSASEENGMAVYGFRVLGSQAKDAVPELLHIYHQKVSRTSQVAALEALSVIGPAAEQAIPIFLKEISDKDPRVRGIAVLALGRIHEQPQRVIPVLTNCLNDTNPIVQMFAFTSLGAFRPGSQSAALELLPMNEVKQLRAERLVPYIDGVLSHLFPGNGSNSPYLSKSAQPIPDF